ncbi:hypothetical protein ACFPAG_08020 [Vogesella sp. GCM10023246]|uniref:Uncharacterized protein n=1 Tax=Vogesella oryzagri TaxID=3160864 RepID=A0ABV1M341_9NEIS
MSNKSLFKDSLKIGLEQASIEANNLKEIQSVFEDLSAALEEDIPGVKMSVERVRKHEETDIFSGIANLTRRAQPQYMDVVAVSSVANGKYTTIAEWRYSRLGFPCTIERKDSKTVCQDKEGLENALSSLLQDPAIVKILLSHSTKTE